MQTANQKTPAWKRSAEATQEINPIDIMEIVDLKAPRREVMPDRRETPSVAPIAFDLPRVQPPPRRVRVESIAEIDLEEELPEIPRRRLGWIVVGAVVASVAILGAGVARRVTDSNDDAKVARPSAAATTPSKPKVAPMPVIPPPPAVTAVAAKVASSIPVVDVNSLPVAAPVGTVSGPAGRLYVDGKKMSGSSALVPCGKHAVRVAPAWRARTIDVPCGGEINVR